MQHATCNWIQKHARSMNTTSNDINYTVKRINPVMTTFRGAPTVVLTTVPTLCTVEASTPVVVESTGQTVAFNGILPNHCAIDALVGAISSGCATKLAGNTQAGQDDALAVGVGGEEEESQEEKIEVGLLYVYCSFTVHVNLPVLVE
ncbi:hypothetical protein Salat_1147800 [Sesamum alatum]|uniref:Uncharacterized protein n=1 Tax=Sesamum alatum TaxID=300844 RepID=A0AAE1YE92_9LAMI|nr:hypothetical protein Salat_1147800 [Sesamum alatum]